MAIRGQAEVLATFFTGFFAGVFTGDGVLEVGSGRRIEGPAAIANTLDYLDEHYPRTMHFVGNHEVTLGGDRAEGLVYCLAHHMYESDDQERDTVMVIRYRDDYRRTAGGWRIAVRRLHIDWQEDRPLSI